MVFYIILVIIFATLVIKRKKKGKSYAAFLSMAFFSIIGTLDYIFFLFKANHSKVLLIFQLFLSLVTLYFIVKEELRLYKDNKIDKAVREKENEAFDKKSQLFLNPDKNILDPELSTEEILDNEKLEKVNQELKRIKNKINFEE